MWEPSAPAKTGQVVSEWKAKPETGKLSARADQAQAHAADGLDYVLATIDQAEEVVLETVVALLDADVAPPASTER
jgi:hypothetical protein